MTITGDEKRSIVTAYGSAKEKLTDVNRRRLTDQAQSDFDGGWYYLGAYGFIKNVAHMEKTGRVNHTFWQWLIRMLIACGAGSVVGGIALAIAKSRMETVHAAFNADAYMDGTRSIERVCDKLIDEHVTRTKIVIERSSGSSGSSGGSYRSSYHSHSSGSSGRSHTSSGRSF